MNAKQILDWAFSDGQGLPFEAFNVAINSYFTQRKLDDSLRIISAFPYLECSRKIFKIKSKESVSYLKNRYINHEEEHNAAYALAICYQEIEQYETALEWFDIANMHPKNSKAKNINIQENIKIIREIIF